MKDKALEIAVLMAQELQDFIDAAQESGDDLPGTRALLEDWERVYSGLAPWQEILVDSDDKTEAIKLGEDSD